MRYQVRINGKTSLIQHSGVGIDQESEINQQISLLTSKKASQRTSVENQRIRDLETIKSMWRAEDGQPTVPTSSIRACIEQAARKTKDGPAVREGLIVQESTFEHQYGTDLDSIAKATQFTCPVVVQRARILRTRAKFDLPWAVDFILETDPDLVDETRLRNWLELAGRRIGLGDWRPQKSGNYGTFELESIQKV